MSEVINVVGSGIAGSMVAHLLREAGREVRVIDDGDTKAASRASSNLFIDSWLKKFSKDEVKLGLAVVERLFKDKIDQPFRRGIAAAAKVRHIHPDHLLVKPDVDGLVMQAKGGGIDVRVGGESQWFEGPTVLCTGYRAAQLIPGVEIDVKVGHCLHIDGNLGPAQSTLSLASPYVHQKLYQLGPGVIYFADSVAVSRERYERDGEALVSRTRQRAEKLLGREVTILRVVTGFRPLMEGYDFSSGWKCGDRLWALNGGGKNGIVAYAQAASKLVKELLR